MILILDCTRQDLPLLRREFVSPIQTIIAAAGYETLIQPLAVQSIPDETTAIILTGTALMDHQYIETGLAEVFLTGIPILGICAGMQLLTLTFGGNLVPCEKIGMTEITVIREDPLFSGKGRFNAWELHQSGIEIPDEFEVLVRSASGVQGIRHRNNPWFGVLFHPEVRNEWVILNFLRIFAIPSSSMDQ